MFSSMFGSKKYETITPEEGRRRLQANPDIRLLDVRAPEEYREIHIPHSISLPLDRLKSGIGKIVPDRGAEILVYCLSGARADTACRQLTAMGYTRVATMGGIRSWPYETERSR